MGRSKKRSRASKARLNPLNNANGTSAKDANLITKKIQPLLTQLQSAVPNERSMAISSISVLCEDPHMRQLLLKEKLIHIILTHSLNDDNKDVVIESYGLLRNLTLEEGYDVSIYLWRNDIWVAIKEGFKQVVSSLQSMYSAVSDSKMDKKQISNHNQAKTLLFDYADNLISLLVSLTNNSDDILNEILNDENLPIVFDLIANFQQYGFKNLTTALQNTILDLIYDFSSESLDFIDALIKQDAVISLIDSLRKDAPVNELTQVLLQGILMQVLEADENATLHATECIEFIQSITKAIQPINLQQMNSDLNLVIKDEVDIPKLKEQAKKRQLAMMQMQALEIGLDLLAGIIEMVSSLDVDVSENLSTVLLSIIPPVLDALLEQFADRVFIVWNNMLWLFIGADDNVDEAVLRKVWNDVAKCNDDDITSIKMSKVSVMWVILKICGNQGNIALLTEFNVWNNASFSQTVIEQYQAVAEVEFKQRCCALLATVASYQTQNTEINQLVGNFFLEQLVSKDTPVEILVEITSALFELYSDSEFTYDLPVFVNGGYLAILQDKVLPNLRNVFKMVDKNKDPALKEKCNDTFNTLQSFIQYKATERS